MSSPTKNYRIAIIEDDIALVRMYQMKFEMEGYEVITAGDGQSGLKVIEEFKPDIVLLDLMMPVMRGDEMLRELRTYPWGKDVEVIILTNMGESEIPADIYKLGVKHFIVKASMTPKEVARFVKGVLAQ